MDEGDEHTEYEIKSMKYRENSMECEIELMKREEKSLVEPIIIRSEIYDEMESMNKKFERMKKHEKQLDLRSRTDETL